MRERFTLFPLPFVPFCNYALLSPHMTPGEGINAISLQHLEEDDVKEVISKLSPGGRGVFKTIWRENRLVIPVSSYS